METRRFRATVEYDGTHYCGFQRQVPSRPTIQARLEQALARIASRPVPVTGAGRTDTGVHASGQVISFDLAWSHDEEALCRALNANLPADIAVRDLMPAAAAFHPRFAARRRLYHYYLYNAPVRSPLRRLRSWHLSRPLALAPMNEAAAALVGEHDFATFGRPPQGDNTVRTVYRAHWSRHDEEDMLVFAVEGNAFLQRMVRSLVGSLRLVGDGRWSVADFLAAFHARDRARAGQTAPPEGLCLVAVFYD